MAERLAKRGEWNYKVEKVFLLIMEWKKKGRLRKKGTGGLKLLKNKEAINI